MCFDNRTAELTQYALEIGKLPGLKGEPTPAQAKRSAIGWRVWRVKEGGLRDKPELQSMSATAIWVPGKPMETHATITETNISTGVHAFGSVEKLLKYQGSGLKTAGRNSRLVMGEILLWGLTAVHYEDLFGKKGVIEGYRAQYGYPLKLWCANSALQVALRDRYDVWVGRAFIPQMLADRKAA